MPYLYQIWPLFYMSLLILAPDKSTERWEEAFHHEDENVEIEVWPQVRNKENVHFAVCWNQPEYVLDQYPNLKAVSSFGAGVDHLVEDQSIPEHVDICRIVAPSLVRQMQGYVLNAVLTIQRKMLTYICQQENHQWQLLEPSPAKDMHIGVMGLGKIGKPVARKLAEMNYKVFGWSRSAKDLQEVKCFAGDNELHNFLDKVQLLVCLLPLTSQTEGVLNLEVFKKMKQGGWIINAARGEHLVDEDLIYALEADILQGAWLDVFSEEPLPDRHPFWNRSDVIITPHIASLTCPEDAAPQIAENYKRVLSGMSPRHLVNRNRGY